MRTFILSENSINREETICFFRLQNNQGITVDVTNWGAALTAATIPDYKGNFDNILLGYGTAEEYMHDDYYLGAIIGPFANRIQGAKLTIGKETYQLDRNDGINSNHSGSACVGRKCWSWKLTDKGICFSILTRHLEGGYPGNIRITITYSLTDTNELHIDYAAETDRTTYVNLTNHAYFNLGNHEDTITGHLLQVNSPEILETDSAFIPTGRYVDVKGSPFDFLSLRPIGSHLHAPDNQQLVWNKGYNHCYVFNRSAQKIPLAHVASLIHPTNRRRVDVFTDYPGMLLYTAGYYRRPDTGVCFEAQYFPGTPSHPHFPSCLLNPGEQYRHQTIFKFSINQIVS